MNYSDTYRFLFVLWDGGGTIPPALALVRRVLAAGHSVRVLGPLSIEKKVKSLGADFSPTIHAPVCDPGKADTEKKGRSPAAVAMAACDEYARDVEETIASFPVDIVVADYLLTGVYAAAEAAGIPCASLVPSVYPLPLPGLPPFGSGFSPAIGIFGQIRDTVVNFVYQRVWNMNLKGLNRTRKRLGLPPVRSMKDQMLRAGRILVLTSSDFDFPAQLPAHAVYCGPQQDEPGQAAPWQSPWGEKQEEQPLILVSLSTTYQEQEDLIQRILDAVDGLPVHVLATLGHAISPERFHAPSNSRLVPFAPHGQILPHTALVITHGGHGTVLKALSYGVPVLVLPMGRDQGDIAARVERLGAGKKVSKKADPLEIRSAVTAILDDPGFRKAAAAIAEKMTQKNEPARAVVEMEALIRESKEGQTQ